MKTNGNNIFLQAYQTEGIGWLVSPRLSDMLALPAAGGVSPA